MLTLTLLVVCAGGALASSVRPASAKLIYAAEEADRHFEEFMQTYNRKYADEHEKQKRFKIFQQNLKNINELNAMEDENAEFGITQFSDLTQEEFEKYTCMLPVSDECKLLTNSSQTWQSNGVTKCKTEDIGNFDMSSVPDSFDWRDKNVVTEAKNQGHCGSCWAFSTTGNIEGQYAIKHKKLLEFSEQQLLDCDKVDHGCHGGLMQNAFGVLIDMGGIMTEQQYPYKAIEGRCIFDKRRVAAKLTGCTVYDLQDDEKLKALLYNKGPISLAMCVKQCFPNVKNYKKGIVKNCGQGKLDHAVLLVGYGTEGNIPYWIIKNSWGGGEKWGENGFFRLRRGVNACSIMNSCAASSIVA